MLTSPIFYSLDQKNGFFIDTAEILKVLVDFSDKNWISYYNNGLRFIYLSENLILDNPLVTQQHTPIHNSVRRLNYLAEVHHYEPVVLDIVSAENLRQIKKKHSQELVDQSRRRFFLSLRPKLSESTEPNKLEQTYLPHMISLNWSTCTTCDACLLICPNKALLISENYNSNRSENTTEIPHTQTSYEVKPELCDGCGLCESVCASNSMTIKTDFFDTEKIIKNYTVTKKNCTHCNNIFHLNPTTLTDFDLCYVCRKQKHLKGALRVFE